MSKNPKKSLREKEVWKWITKEMPYKHSDRFVPLFKIICTQIQKARQEEREKLKKILEGIVPKKKTGEYITSKGEGWNVCVDEITQKIIKALKELDG